MLLQFPHIVAFGVLVVVVVGAVVAASLLAASHTFTDRCGICYNFKC